MKLRLVICATACYVALMVPAHAQPWQFGKPVNVTSVHGEGIFHHLESAGRRNIAIAGEQVGVAWEDNRSGQPAIYLAIKPPGAAGFGNEQRLSEDGEAYEPSLVALDTQRFAVAWEQDGQIHVRLSDAQHTGPILRLKDQNAGQASLAAHDGKLWLVYAAADQETGYRRIYARQLTASGLNLQAEQACAVDSEPPKQSQLYPTLVPLSASTVVAWEDRRPGHTIIMAAENRKPNQCLFGAPQRISEPLPGPRPPYGKGHGVTRVAMSGYADQRILAAWADKRDFREGYDIYASHYPAGNKALFGPNQKVQDDFGGVAQQWHPTVAGNPAGQLVVAWDDDRDGSANIMLSYYQDNAWSDDLTVPGASGKGEQNHPSLIMDDLGNLHLAWVERDSVGGPTRLRYLLATAESSSP